MITCKLQGGLGNQLFQIFTTIAYSLSNVSPFFFLNEYQLGQGSTTIRYTYWKTFLSALQPFLKKKNTPRLSMLREASFKYELLPQNINNNNIMLVGYFQSPLYFDNYKNTICRLIKLEQQQQSIKTKFLFELGKELDFKTTVSLHFRLGDYKKYPTIHPILKDTYYRNALSYIQRNNNLKIALFFCENEDIKEVSGTIHELQKIFPQIQFIRANPTLEDWEQLLLMSLCEYNIIANSTFSWWGAYLNNNQNKVICYPSQWFGPQAGHDTSTLFPLNWTKIDVN
jgi:hypothetical protein